MKLFPWFSQTSQAPLLEEDATQWVLQTFNWCLDHFDARFFYEQSQLVIPSNKHFPGRVDSPHEMAELIFARVKEYAGMAHWPLELAPAGSYPLQPPVKIQLEGPVRGGSAPLPDAPRISLSYDPAQIRNPEALIASYAHTLAHYLGATASRPPPGGAEHWPYATEILAIFLGFGLMFANSAFVFQGGCGSCATAGRAAYLSEYEATYALAIFCVLKQIPPTHVTRYLKKHLRGFCKRAMREIPAHLETSGVVAE